MTQPTNDLARALVRVVIDTMPIAQVRETVRDLLDCDDASALPTTDEEFRQTLADLTAADAEADPDAVVAHCRMLLGVSGAS